MLQIFIIIVFQISSKIVSLCPKCTDYSHYSLPAELLQLFFFTFTLKTATDSVTIFCSLYILLSETVTAY